MSKPIQLIVACAENRVIGRSGRLPFDIPEDQEWFHQRTANQVVVLGRVCYETWPHVHRDGRQPVVISSQPKKILAHFETLTRNAAGVAGKIEPPVIVDSVPAALQAAEAKRGEIMICGGQRIYEETLSFADRLLLTLVHATIEGDTYFPDWRHLTWKESWKRTSQDANYRYTFSILDRVR